jgi:hypothetical protein
MFVRTKTISGHKYGYLVENTWTSKGSRQQTKAYLGKVIPLPSQDTPSPNITKLSYKNAIITLAHTTLLSCGFKKTKNYRKEKLIFDDKTYETTQKKKPVVLKIKDGYFCKQTLDAALNFNGKGREEEVGKRLAHTLVNAGLLVDETTFVQLFKKVFKRYD